jgi:hypothetical protein
MVSYTEDHPPYVKTLLFHKRSKGEREREREREREEEGWVGGWMENN